MIPTKFQLEVQKRLKAGKNLLLIAPTGLGKTFAVTSDLQDEYNKTIYAVPLRSLGGGIQKAINELHRDSKEINAKIHHGDSQESILFSEEIVITTYDQVVCGVPGLPLSLPLKAGHAVAGALLMSRLVLDEVHLAWNISEHALSILLGIIIYGGIIRADLHRIGMDDYWYLQNGANRLAIDPKEQKKRQVALIQAIANFIASPSGAKTAGWAPHVFLTEGAILLTSSRTAPFCSPIKVSLNDTNTPVSADLGYADSMKKLENKKDTWVWTFKDVSGLIEASKNAIETLSGTINAKENANPQE